MSIYNTAMAAVTSPIPATAGQPSVLPALWLLRLRTPGMMITYPAISDPSHIAIYGNDVLGKVTGSGRVNVENYGGHIAATETIPNY